MPFLPEPQWMGLQLPQRHPSPDPEYRWRRRSGRKAARDITAQRAGAVHPRHFGKLRRLILPGSCQKREKPT